MAADDPVQVVKSSGLQTVRDSTDARNMADSLVRGAIESLKRPISVPSTDGVDLSDIESMIMDAGESTTATNKVIDTETKRTNDAAARQKDAQIREGKAGAEEILAKADRAKQEASLYENFASMFGVSTDVGSEVAVTAQRVRQLEPVAEAKLRRVQQMQSVGPLDNPLEWLTNQIQLPAAIGDYNNEAAIVNALQERINARIENGQKAATFAAKGIPTITAATAKAEADKVVAGSEKLAAIVDENLAKTNVTFAIHKLANDINLVNATEKMTGMEIENEKMRYQSLINEINLADTHANRLLKAAQLLETLEKTKGLDIVLEQYDLTMGHPKGTTTRYIFDKFPEEQRQNMVAIGAGSIGSNPFEGMVNWYKSRPGPGASPETAAFFDYVQEKAATISVNQKIQGLDEKQKPIAIGKMLKAEIANDINGAAKMGNIFYEMSPKAMIASKSIPADSHLISVLKPFTEVTGPVPTNLVLSAIDAEYKNPNEAGAIIADYYSRNMKLRNGVMNTSLAGVALPQQYNYRRSILGEGTFGGSTSMQFDLTKPEEATKFILINRAAKAAAAAMKSTLVGGR